MDAKEINKKWGGQMLTELTHQNSAIVLMIGFTKESKPVLAMTNDIDKNDLITIIEVLQKQILKL